MPLWPWGRWLTGAWKSRTRAADGRRARAVPWLETLEPRLTPTTPAVLSILRTTPAGPLTNATSVGYIVTFDQPVTGVDASDFHLTTGGGVQAAPPVVVSGGDTVYGVTVNGIRGSGPLRLD